MKPLQRVGRLCILSGLAFSLQDTFPSITCAEPPAPPSASKSKTALTGTSQQQSSLQFVQSFYDWYAAESTRSHTTSLLEYALQKRKNSFEQSLYKLLTADVEASKKSPGEIVGLDFDPFFNTNAEPAKSYQVRYHSIKSKDNDSLDILAISGSRKEFETIGTVNVTQKAGLWQISNIHYLKPETPENENLRSILQFLAKNRGK